MHRSSRFKRCSKQREGGGEGGVEYSSRCCALCAGAALLPAQNAYNKFHTFLLRLPVSPPLTGKCAQLQGSHDLLVLLLVCCKRQRKSWSTLRLVRALHLICILGLPPRCRGGDRNSLTWLGWVPAQPKGSRVRHAQQQQRRGTCGIRQPKLYSLPLLPAPCYPLHNSLSHFLYASTVC